MDQYIYSFSILYKEGPLQQFRSNCLTMNEPIRSQKRYREVVKEIAKWAGRGETDFVITHLSLLNPPAESCRNLERHEPKRERPCN